MNDHYPTAPESTPRQTEAKPIVIYGGPLYDGNGTVYKDGAVYISRGVAVAVGEEETVFGQIPKSVDMEVYDTLGCVIFPGLINLHHHLYRSFAIGLPAFASAVNSSNESNGFWEKYAQCLDDEIVQLAVLAGILNSIKAGITTIFDLHSSPVVINKILTNIASVISRAEIRAVLSLEISNRNGEDVFNRALEENQKFLETSPENPLIRGMIGLQIDRNMPDKNLALVGNSLKNANGVHIHVASGGSIERLNRYGLLGAKTLVAGHLPDNVSESQLLKESDAVAVHSPCSLTVDRAGHDLLNFKTGIGSGGVDSSLIAAIRHEFNQHNYLKTEPSRLMLHLDNLLRTNATFAGQFFPGKPGILAKGNTADIVIFDYKPVTEINSENYLTHILFGMQNAPAKTVLTNGRFIYNDHTFLTLDEAIISDECQKASERLWKKFN